MTGYNEGVGGACYSLTEIVEEAKEDLVQNNHSFVHSNLMCLQDIQLEKSSKGQGDLELRRRGELMPFFG